MGLCILVVDDEPDQRLLCRHSLEGVGYSVLEAESGQEAVACFAGELVEESESPIDLVVLDMVLGGDMDGLATYQAIRERAPHQKVLVVSGHAHGASVKQMRELGADWLAKPYERDALARAVQARLSRP